MQRRQVLAFGSLLLVGLAAGFALPRSARAPRPLLAGPVCEPTRPAAPVGRSCDVGRHDQCWEELSARTAPRPTTAVGFEAASEREQPESFVPIVEREVERCDPDAVVEVTDCATYPCVAAVRPGRDWLEAGCEWETYGDAEIVSVPLDVMCPGGPERMFYTVLLDEASARAALGLSEDDEGNGLIAGLIGQRVDTLLELWPCTGS